MHRAVLLRLSCAALGLALLFMSGCTGQDSPFSPRPGIDEEVWAIRAVSLHGPRRMEYAKVFGDSLKQVRGLKPDLVQVLDEEDDSVVYYGRYRREYDAMGNPKGYRPDHMKDLNLIRNLSMNAQGLPAWPFAQATMEPLPTARPQHPEWNLEHQDCFWSLHIAVFYNEENMRNRRFAAEEYCRILREQGEEAFFHHGVNNSSVTIGRFAKDAIAEIKREDPLTGVTTFVSRIVDPRMLELQKKYPTSLQNGCIFYEIRRDPQTQEVKERVPVPSFPVLCPKAERAESGL